MTRSILKRAATVAMLVVASATAAQAQIVNGWDATKNPTPKGDITNTASATYLDARGNSYSATSNAATIKVGLRGAPEVTVTPATNSVNAAGSSSATFTVTNHGNDTDSFGVVFGGSGYSNAIYTVTYKLNSGDSYVTTGLTDNGSGAGVYTQAQMATLQADVVALNINRLGAIQIVVAYDHGAASGSIVLTATSQGDEDTVANTQTDAATHTITYSAPSTTYGVTVASQGTTSITAQYGDTVLVSWVVTNTGNAAATFNLALTQSVAGIFSSITRVTSGGAAEASTTTGSIAASGTETVYARAILKNNQQTPPAAGTYNDALILTATHTTQATTTAADNFDFTTQTAAARTGVTMTKSVFTDNAGTMTATPINGTTDRVFPGQFIWYEIAVTTDNATGQAASNVSVSDVLPAAVTYDSHSATDSPDTNTWTAGTSTLNVVWNSFPANTTRYVRIRVQVKEAP